MWQALTKLRYVVDISPIAPHYPTNRIGELSLRFTHPIPSRHRGILSSWWIPVSIAEAYRSIDIPFLITPEAYWAVGEFVFIAEAYRSIDILFLATPETLWDLGESVSIAEAYRSIYILFLTTLETYWVLSESVSSTEVYWALDTLFLATAEIYCVLNQSLSISEEYWAFNIQFLATAVIFNPWWICIHHRNIPIPWHPVSSYRRGKLNTRQIHICHTCVLSSRHPMWEYVETYWGLGNHLWFTKDKVSFTLFYSSVYIRRGSVLSSVRDFSLYSPSGQGIPPVDVSSPIKQLTNWVCRKEDQKVNHRYWTVKY